MIKIIIIILMKNNFNQNLKKKVIRNHNNNLQIKDCRLLNNKLKPEWILEVKINNNQVKNKMIL